MPKINGASGDGVQAALLTLRILEYFGFKKSSLVSLTSLSEALNTTKSRIHRHLQTMVIEDYLTQPPNSERYRAGPRLMALARLVSDNTDLLEAASDVMLELRDSLGHFCTLAELEDKGMRVRSTLSGTSQVQVTVKLGSVLRFHSSAQGKIALAFGPAKIRTKICRSRLEMITAKTITSTAKLQNEVSLIQKQGWAVAPHQTALGLNALAAPIFDATQQLVGTIAIVDMIQFLDDPPSKKQIKQVTDAARAISRALGYIQG